MSSNNNRRGSALLTVLWLTAALSAIGLAVANNVRGETERAATHVDDVKTWFLARGAVERAALYYLWGRDYYVPGNPALNFEFPAGEAHVDMIPENSKLGVNHATPDELLRLMAALGVSGESAIQTVSAILDWRKPDPLHESPFDSFYLSQSPSFLPRHASFLENEELLLVRGMTPDLYYGSPLGNAHAGLRDCVSVYSAGGSVDINTAQPATLEAIGIAPPDVDAIVKTRSAAPILDPRQFNSIVQATGTAGRRLAMGGGIILTLRATARLRQPDGKLSDMRRTVAAVVKFNLPGNADNLPVGFEVIRWYDRA
jgi:general secretion pathway protein K